MRIGEYLFGRVKRAGVDYAFGIPDDFALPLFNAMDQSGLKVASIRTNRQLGLRWTHTFACEVSARDVSSTWQKIAESAKSL